jgi:hypothetical protein
VGASPHDRRCHQASAPVSDTPRLVIGRIEPPCRRPAREELVTHLGYALAQLKASMHQPGAAYRKGLVERIEDLLEREKRAGGDA